MASGMQIPETRTVAPPVGESRNLDGLRAIATLFVVVFHLELAFQYMPHRFAFIGHWGVLILFFHTSCVLMYSLRRQAGGKNLWLGFLVRRCFRIYPLSIVIILGVYLFDLPVGHFQQGDYIAVKLGIAGLLSNVLLLQDVTGSESIMATLWSLPYQMHMCLLLPFLRSARLYPLYILLGLWMASVAVALISPITVYLPCFMGGVIAFGLTGLPELKRWRLPCWALPVLITVLTVAYMAHPGRITGWLGCLVLGVTIPLFEDMPKNRLWRVFNIISRYSFGIYMTHFIAIWLVVRFLGGQTLGVQLTVFAISTAAATVFLYHVIEDPMNSLGKRLASRLSTARSVPQPGKLREHAVWNGADAILAVGPIHTLQSASHPAAASRSGTQA